MLLTVVTIAAALLTLGGYRAGTSPASTMLAFSTSAAETPAREASLCVARFELADNKREFDVLWTQVEELNLALAEGTRLLYKDS